MEISSRFSQTIYRLSQANQMPLVLPDSRWQPDLLIPFTCVLVAEMSNVTDLDYCDKLREFQLVQINGTWNRRRGSEHSDHQGHLSPAKIYESSTADGVCWTVVSPIVFTYRIIQCNNLLDADNDTLLFGHTGCCGELQNSSKPIKRFIVIDETVHALYGSRISEYLKARNVVYKMLPLPTTEENKSMELVTTILEEVHQFGIDRRSEPILAIGGGVCLDIVGLAASLYRRRTPYIRIPTTLLAYVDASVGAKNGVNFANCKNKLGSYIPPVAVFLDRSFLGTVPRRHIANGLAEMLKMALMKHKGLFELLESEGPRLLDSKFQTRDETDRTDQSPAASASSRIAIETMLEELAPNLWEDELDRLVDFGHLISPELEMKVLPALLHGEAVTIDMSLMVYVACERGLLTAALRDRVVRCMRALELPVWHAACSLELVREALGQRLKHSGGLVRMPLPTALGRAGTGAGERSHGDREGIVLGLPYSDR
ncbi:hypothetical protein AALO_G00059610 [Alosa alosa]|uniref:2-epi-5-epi-valiolone synthase n=1 Tax=Alosa alosa TaxID=278164 RepID=A0AAV6HAC4_9TELE|nr:hypothetical protein AALO_G00059610 [Alosa alosa]